MDDATVLAELYERKFRAFLAGALALVGEPEAARDVVQEAFARALNRRRAFRGTWRAADRTVEAWVWRIVMNLARDVRRRRRWIAPEAIDLAEVIGLDYPSSAGVALRDQLRELPERQKLAVFLHYFADLPYDEVAELLGVAPGTVAASLHAARTTLRVQIEEAYE